MHASGWSRSSAKTSYMIEDLLDIDPSSDSEPGNLMSFACFSWYCSIQINDRAASSITISGTSVDHQSLFKVGGQLVVSILELLRHFRYCGHQSLYPTPPPPLKHSAFSVYVTISRTRSPSLRFEFLLSTVLWTHYKLPFDNILCFA